MVRGTTTASQGSTSKSCANGCGAISATRRRRPNPVFGEVLELVDERLVADAIPRVG
jgi:hypothetical protein